MEQGKEALKNFLHAIAPSDSKKRRVLCKGRTRLWVLPWNSCIAQQYHIYILVPYLNIIAYHFPQLLFIS